MVYNFDISSISKGMPSTVDTDQLCLSEWTELLRYDSWVNW